mmetsp:Transcript_108583/g.306117  ORF Transcript_108583/g.306117 Transcript_108583/m.306117 type:complete len:246 (-) Transcript_108583:1815-2552(-)
MAASEGHGARGSRRCCYEQHCQGGQWLPLRRHSREQSLLGNVAVREGAFPNPGREVGEEALRRINELQVPRAEQLSERGPRHPRRHRADVRRSRKVELPNQQQRRGGDPLDVLLPIPITQHASASEATVTPQQPAVEILIALHGGKDLSGGARFAPANEAAEKIAGVHVGERGHAPHLCSDARREACQHIGVDVALITQGVLDGQHDPPGVAKQDRGLWFQGHCLANLLDLLYVVAQGCGHRVVA